MSTHAIRCPFNKLTDYGYSAFYKIIADGSRVKIAAAFTNDLLSIQQKAIFKKLVRSPNHWLVGMAAGSERSGQNDGKHQAVPHNNIIKFSAAAVKPHARDAIHCAAGFTKRSMPLTPHEGKYIATDDNGWSPYISVEEANKSDIIRDALKHGDIKMASQSARIFSLTPFAV